MKPLPFWEWMIADVRARHPDAIFLAEAFTRPNMMYRLAKVGFSQSYTYFTWRDGKQELVDYVTELTTTATPYFANRFRAVQGRRAPSQQDNDGAGKGRFEHQSTPAMFVKLPQ